MGENKESRELATEHFAMEVLKQEQEKSKAKNLGVVGLTVGFIGLAIATAAITIHLTNVNYKNDCDWRKLFPITTSFRRMERGSTTQTMENKEIY